MFIGMSSDAEPNGSDSAIVTVVLQYDVFATLLFVYDKMGSRGHSLIQIKSGG